MTRESTSRPRRSVPARNSADGGCVADREPLGEGRIGRDPRPKTAQITTTAMISTATTTTPGAAAVRSRVRVRMSARRAHDGDPAEADARIDQRIDHVDDQVDEHHEAGEDQRRPLDQRDVALLHRVDDQRAEAGKREGHLDIDRAGEQADDDDARRR